MNKDLRDPICHLEEYELINKKHLKSLTVKEALKTCAVIMVTANGIQAKLYFGLYLSIHQGHEDLRDLVGHSERYNLVD